MYRCSQRTFADIRTGFTETVCFGRLCRMLDYVDLVPCAYPETLAGAEDDKATVDIIHKPPSIWKCSRRDIQGPIIVVLPVFVRLHRK